MSMGRLQIPKTVVAVVQSNLSATTTAATAAAATAIAATSVISI
jgi:hypothetical protein